MDDQKIDKKRLTISFLFSGAFVVLIWIIKAIEIYTDSDFTNLGLFPLHPKGLIGILTGPLIHSDWKHLTNNTLPMLFLGWGLFYFYKEIAFKIFFLVYFISQFWLWFFARQAWHIGASSLIYGLGAFLFVSGIIRRNRNLMAISLLVAFVYGSMVWGLLPLEERISWEGHLTGLLAGIVLSFHYKKFGPPLPGEPFEDEEEEDDDFGEEYYYSDSTDKYYDNTSGTSLE